jgi:predicted PurR-regulated permease PerM
LNPVGLIFRQHWRLIVFVLAIVLIFWLLWVLRSVFLPFILGFMLASLILPLIRLVEKHLPGAGRWPKHKQLKRVTIVAVVYLIALVFIALVVFYTVTLVVNAIGTLSQDASQIIPDGMATITEALKAIPFLASPFMQENIELYMAKAEAAIPGMLSDFLTLSFKNIQTSSSMILSFLVMPVFMFFILKDWDRLRDRFYAMLPLWARTHTKSIFSILKNVLGRYLRGQFIQAVAVGLFAFALLSIMGIEFAIPLAVFAGLTEVVPTIGPWLGGGLAVMVTLATAPEKFVWVALGFLVIQLLENSLLVPRVQGTQMEIHPAFIMILVLLGAHFAGLVGFIIVLPLTMTVMKIFKYLVESTHEGKIS